ncbi:MAG: Ldh family oxidoreductase [Polyangiaceae bacterium]
MRGLVRDDREAASVFDVENLRELALALARDAGAEERAAADMVDAMLEADLRGVETHGLARLAPYLERIRSQAVNGRAVPSVTARDGIVDVDACNAIGHHGARLACDALIAQGPQHPVGVATIRNSNHFGFAGYYTSLLARRGFVALCTSNGTPCVAPPGGIRPFLSNDPFAISAADGDVVIELDLALSSTSRANVRRAFERGEMIPANWALGPDGLPTDDPAAALKGTMLPLAGERGFGLLFAIEIFAGLLSGGAAADQVGSKERPDAIERTSHALIALRTDAFPFGETFGARLRMLVDGLRAAPRRSGTEIPRYPGERRWAMRAERLREGVPIAVETVRSLQTLAHDCGIAFPQQRVPVESKR